MEDNKEIKVKGFKINNPLLIAIACHDYGFDLTGCELDPEYYAKGIERVKNHISQTKLF